MLVYQRVFEMAILLIEKSQQMKNGRTFHIMYYSLFQESFPENPLIFFLDPNIPTCFVTTNQAALSVATASQPSFGASVGAEDQQPAVITGR